MKNTLSEIYALLHRLGLTANYTGFFYISYAVFLSIEEPERLRLLTKWLYPDVATQYGTNWKAAERNIRTAGSIIWRKNKTLLESLAGSPLPQKPCNAQLLAILVAALHAGPGMPPYGSASQGQRWDSENIQVEIIDTESGSWYNER